MTVSINDEFIDADKKAVTVLKDGDNVEFLYFMGRRMLNGIDRCTD